MNWKQTKYGDTILDVIKNRSGMEESEILHPKPIPPEAIENLTQAAALLQDAIQKKVPISIMGDYDVDGITASAILYYLIRFLGKQTPFIRLPRRMSEGYGLSVDAFDDFHQGLLITVDNGISATEEIAYAKDLGFSVLVIDHHLPGKFLPEADVIVDPHIHPDKNGFEHYCGAGLSLKLAELMLRDNPAASSLMDKLKVLATLGTIADVMPLVSDNRRIVMEGLRLWQSGSKAIPYGLTALVEAAEVYGRTETDIAFKIAPILNAPGRLLDNGAERHLTCCWQNRPMIWTDTRRKRWQRSWWKSMSGAKLLLPTRSLPPRSWSWRNVCSAIPLSASIWRASRRALLALSPGSWRKITAFPPSSSQKALNPVS